MLRATLDCTYGWYSRQDWTGVPLGTLLHRGPGAQSVYVHSVTGYWWVKWVDRVEVQTTPSWWQPPFPVS